MAEKNQSGNQSGQTQPSKKTKKVFDAAANDKAIQNALQHLLAIDLSSLNQGQKAVLAQRFAGAIGVQLSAAPVNHGPKATTTEGKKPKTRSAEEKTLMEAESSAFQKVREASNGGKDKLPDGHPLLVAWMAAKAATKLFRSKQEPGNTENKPVDGAAAAASKADEPSAQ